MEPADWGFSGLRKGEMLALQWSDIDFENSTVSVTKAAAVVDGKQVCKAPKTKNSRREVSIPRFLTDRLHNLMVEQTKNKESLGAYWKGNNWLFTQSAVPAWFWSACSHQPDTECRYHPPGCAPVYGFHRASRCIPGNS